MRIDKTKDKVKDYLRRYKFLQDDDNRLVTTVWYFEMKENGYTPDQMTGTDALRIIASGELTTAEAITRARRKMQEENPELRGTKWHERHNHQEDVIEQLGYPNNQIQMFND